MCSSTEDIKKYVLSLPPIPSKDHVITVLHALPCLRKINPTDVSLSHLLHLSFEVLESFFYDIVSINQTKFIETFLPVVLEATTQSFPVIFSSLF